MQLFRQVTWTRRVTTGKEIWFLLKGIKEVKSTRLGEALDIEDWSIEDVREEGMKDEF